MNIYRAFGLTLASDLDFPELPPLPEHAGDVDVAVFEASLDPVGFEDDGIPEGPKRLVLPLKKIGRFMIEGGARVRYRRAEGVDDDLLRLYLLGSCMGALLMQRGYVVLHGNAVTTDGKNCRVIVGHSGAGKSTEAAWHFREGSGILADDVCAVDFDAEGRPRVTPSYPQIKLWRASAGLLGLPVEGLRRIYGREDKFAIPLGHRFVTEPMTLAQVTELHPERRETAAVTGFEKVNHLLVHTYRPRFAARMGIKPAYMGKLTRVARAIDMALGARRDLGAA